MDQASAREREKHRTGGQCGVKEMESREARVTGRPRRALCGLCSIRRKGKRCGKALLFRTQGKISTKVLSSVWRHDAFSGGSWIDGVLVRPW